MVNTIMTARAMNPSIQSLGAPPERHADRVVAEMMQHLAQTRARLWLGMRRNR
jgi:hypothetical protein